MPFGFIYQCNKCSCEVTVSIGWEYYVDANGIRKKCGHPGMSDEAKKYGTKGFLASWYCPKCQQLKEAVIAEFSSPRNGSLDACLAYSDPAVEHKDFLPICEVCGSVLIECLENLPCPKCRGKFKESGRFMA